MSPTSLPSADRVTSGNPIPFAQTVVFDLGGVLVDWNPRHLYRALFADDPAAMERFLGEICTEAWHRKHDSGVSFAENAADLIRRHPGHADMIRAWGARFDAMIPGPIAGTVAILEQLAARGVPLYAVTNWPGEHFPTARVRFPFFSRFRDIAVSGVERIAKPDPGIWRVLFARNALDPKECVYIDDVAANVEAAARLGMTALHFTDPAGLAADLSRLGLLQG
jgi:2-haloacid dehalogenase